MTDSKNLQKPYRELFPISTSITDFAYPLSHPLRGGNFNISYIDDGIEANLSDNEKYGDEVKEEEEDELNYSSDEINRKAIALFDFTPENDNEVTLTEGQIIWISYRHGQGWLVAEDSDTGENGLVPEEYVEIFTDDEEEHEDSNYAIEDVPKPFLPEILQNYHGNISRGEESDTDWVDTDDDVDAQIAHQTMTENQSDDRPNDTSHSTKQDQGNAPSLQTVVDGLLDDVGKVSLS